MGELTFRKDFGKFLFCSSLLEERVARAYERVAELAEDRLICGLLGFIARDSLKHGEFFRTACEWLSGDMAHHSSDCEKVWGEAWKTLVTDAEKFLDRNRISSEELVSLIKRLTELESFVAEEYLTTLHVRLVELMAGEARIDLGPFKTMFEWIIEDEKRHDQILKIIEKLLANRR